MKYFYIFKGQRASIGTPNRITGRLSTYGRYYRFKSNADRQKYIDDYRGSDFIAKVNKKSGRRYSLGCSVYAYEEDLECSPLLCYDEDGKLQEYYWGNHYE